MKVLLINGSPKENGCTFTGLSEIAKTLNQEGIETEIFHIGSQPIQGCIGCGGCKKSDKNRCVFDSDTVNQVIEKAETADGIIVGTPVHYASASGAITSLMDRVFYAGSTFMAFKPGAAIASCRRGGASAAIDQMNKYFTFANMPLISSNYWSMIHGNTPEDVLKDEEGMQTMRQLGRNMAWILKSIDIGRKNGISMPKTETKIKTNYIR